MTCDRLREREIFFLVDVDVDVDLGKVTFIYTDLVSLSSFF